MFSQKKKNYTWMYVCGVLIIAIIAVLILIASLAGSGQEEDALKASLESRADKENHADAEPDSPISNDPGTAPDDNAEGDIPDSDTDEPVEDTKKPEPNQFYQSYYLIQYDKNVIKIFFSDETGNLIELEQTAIVYETLSSADQKRFRDGIKVETRDDLNRIIMDYES